MDEGGDPRWRAGSGYRGVLNELLELGTDAIAAVQDSNGLEDGAQWHALYTALNKDHGPAGYLFKCRHCATLGAYQDNH